ncbi:MAG: pyridoxal-phosphate dependent enzyme, partial [Desulfuromusa sp.]|nr:pyridoxal-phosphate dependent enzyme [Desulfuromusa sp.]
ACVASASLARRNGNPKHLSTRCHTFAEEFAVKQIGELTFPIIEKYVDEIVTVEEEAIARAIVSLMEKEKLIVEGAGAVGLAALLYGLKTIHKGNTVCLLSGGNLELPNMARVVEQGMLAEGNYLKLRLEMVDMPGALAHLTNIISELKANIFQISHDRNKSSLPLGEAEVLLDLETRGSEHIQEILMRLEDERYRPEVIR